MSLIFGRFYCKVSGMKCRVRLRNPPVPSPYTVKETLRKKKKKKKKKKGLLKKWPRVAGSTEHGSYY